jgi:flavin-dependent thymidylate synthase
MKIKLISGPEKNPLDISVGSARTCYSQSLKDPDSVSNWDKKIPLAQDLLASGHHTTLQHAHFTFSFEGVSRFAIWRFFHAHRFYNSDQVSQRYAKIDTENYYLPETLHNRSELEEMHKTLIENYLKLTDIIEQEFKKSDNKVEVKIARKKAMENARYILPQSILANMYHTINLSTLLRYFAISKSDIEGIEEISTIINLMVNEVIEKYPETKHLFDKVNQKEKILKPDQSIFNRTEGMQFNNGVELINISKNVIDFTGNYEYYSDTTGSYTLFSMPESISSFSFKFDISLSADAQNQRHRTSIGIRPELKNEILKINNFNEFIKVQYVPEVFTKNKEAMDIFNSSMQIIFENIPETNLNYVPYILPNSFQITILETTNFSDFAHKAKMRLCLNAQEEIREITENMVKTLSEEGVLIDLFVPPCVSRFISGIKPTCSEGARFCGIKEWKKDKYKKFTGLS